MTRRMPKRGRKIKGFFAFLTSKRGPVPAGIWRVKGGGGKPAKQLATLEAFSGQRRRAAEPQSEGWVGPQINTDSHRVSEGNSGFPSVFICVRLWLSFPIPPFL